MNEDLVQTYKAPTIDGRILTVPEKTGPFRAQGTMDEWAQLNGEMQSLAKKREKEWLEKEKLKNPSFKPQGDTDPGEFAFERENSLLVRGTLNLINTVIEANNNGQPIEVLVFLDKSARLAQYLFQILWEKLVTRNTKYLAIQKPEVIFVNVGKDEPEKRTDNFARELLIDGIKQKYVGKNLLVVDEVILRGVSNVDAQLLVKQSVEESRRLGVAERLTEDDIKTSQVSGLAQFFDVPSWYTDRTHTELKGSRDPVFTKRERELAAAVPVDLRQKIIALLKVVNANWLADFFASNGQVKPGLTPFQAGKLAESGIVPEDVFKEVKALVDTSNQNFLYSMVPPENTIRKWIKPEQLVEYFASFGGFTVLPPRYPFYSQLYRSLLKDMIDLVIKKGLIAEA